jgi:D-lactate dehydrogenase (cytochrome)
MSESLGPRLYLKEKINLNIFINLEKSIFEMIIKTSPDEIQNYLADAANYKGHCEAVYFPENESEVRSILSEANSKSTPVTISGNGTGLTGARVPEGGIVISTDKLNRLIELNETEKYAVVEPGLMLSEFLKITSDKSLFYPPDPTEKNCFIGGTVSTNASGEKTFKYGPTRDYVLALNIVLADGELLHLERGRNYAEGNILKLRTEEGKSFTVILPDYKMPEVKNASGYYTKHNMDAIDLFIGSEGTLGVITKIKLKLLPHPGNILSSVIFFNVEEDALNFIHTAKRRSYATRDEKSKDIDALALEYFDSKGLRFLSADYSNIPASSNAAVWFEQETHTGNEDALVEKWSELITENNGDMDNSWFAFTEADKEKIQGFRHAISAKIIDYISSKGIKKLGTDVAVPDNLFNDFYFYCKREVESSGLDYVIYGHFGNSHMHLNMLPRSIDEVPKGKEIYNNICRKAAELGGTVSAEHGIGKLKPEYLLMMYGEKNIRSMAQIKKTLDPNLILGRGNIFSLAYF